MTHFVSCICCHSRSGFPKALVTMRNAHVSNSYTVGQHTWFGTFVLHCHPQLSTAQTAVKCRNPSMQVQSVQLFCCQCSCRSPVVPDSSHTWCTQ